MIGQGTLLIRPLFSYSERQRQRERERERERERTKELKEEARSYTNSTQTLSNYDNSRKVVDEDFRGYNCAGFRKHTKLGKL